MDNNSWDEVVKESNNSKNIKKCKSIFGVIAEFWWIPVIVLFVLLCILERQLNLLGIDLRWFMK